MNDGIYIDTDLINDAYDYVKKAYKLLTTNNILDIASSIEKMEIIKELSSYKYLKKLKNEIDDLITKADKAKEKCKSLTSGSDKAASSIDFSFSGVENMTFLAKSIYQSSNNAVNQVKTHSKDLEEEKVVNHNNPNYNHNFDDYMENIKEDLGLKEIEKQMGIEIETSGELISILELLKDKFANGKTEKAQLESLIRQLKRYSKIDEFEKKYTIKEEYNGKEQLSDNTKIVQKQVNVPLIEGTSSIEESYIEYKSFKNYLSEEQQHIMAYIYKTEGDEKAYEYYCLLNDQINQLRGMEKAVAEYNKIKSAGEKARRTTTTSSFENIFGGSAYGDTSSYYSAKKKSQKAMMEHMHTTIKGTVNGLEGFTESFENINNMNATELDYERMYLVEALQNDKDLSKGLEESYGFGESFGNMLPTVTVGTIISISTGGAGAPLAMKALQTAITSSMIFGSSYGSKKHQNLLNGYTDEDAKKSAVISALSETLLEEALGTLPGVGKQSGNILLNMFKEGGQEAVQQFAENLGDKFILDQDLDNCLNDSAKAFIYGALMSVTFEAGQTVIYNGAKVVISSETLKKLKVAVNNKNEVEVQKVLYSVLDNQTDTIKSIKKQGIISQFIKDTITEYKKNPNGGYVDISNSKYKMNINDVLLCKGGYQTLLDNAIYLTLEKGDNNKTYNFIYDKIRQCDFNYVTKDGNARAAAMKIASDLSTVNSDFMQGTVHTENDAIWLTLISQNIEPTENKINELRNKIKSGNYNCITSRLGARDYIKNLYETSNNSTHKINNPFNQSGYLYKSAKKFINLDTIQSIQNHYGTIPPDSMAFIENVINNHFHGKFNNNIDYNQNFIQYVFLYGGTNQETIEQFDKVKTYLNSQYGNTFLGRLSIGEAIAVYNYTYGSGVFQRYVGTGKYDPYNQNPNIHSEAEIKKNVAYLDSALRKSGSGLKQNQIFHRGDDFNTILTYMGINNYNDLKKCEGKTKVNKSYLSTGVSKEGAFDKNIHWTIKCEAGKQYGAYVNEISAYYDNPGEYEFIFRRNQKIRFDKVYQKNGKIEIEATILGIEGYNNH